jgi:23S rRNA (cytidine2498-2'-O)-methyltransferase
VSPSEAWRRIHVAPEGFERELAIELDDASALGERLFATHAERDAAWAENSWLAPEVIPISSIGDAAAKLRARGRNWILHPLAAVRRSRLIEEKLPRVKGRVLAFPEAPPPSPLGAFCLLDEATLLASPVTSRPFPHGVAVFAEDREGPPSRAYLKLWEALTLRGEHPRPGERCLDLGASPGGWTWVCAKLGADVLAVDKAALDPRVAAMPGVRALQESAFALDPDQVGEVDWLLCDVICYPERLLKLVQRWQRKARRFVCTLKFQGETDHDTARAFAAIPGSRLLHLSHNKHELTWMM